MIEITPRVADTAFLYFRFLSFHTFANYVKVTFFAGASLAEWIQQAATLPGGGR